jgi:choline dehydrogenase-like flavoprotein
MPDIAEFGAQVIIVGSGPAGVSATFPLLEAGIRVLMLDASGAADAEPPASRPLGEFRRDPGRWRERFGADLAGLTMSGDVSPKFATPLARSVLAGFAESNGLTTRNFLAAGSLGRGGLSPIWGALATRFDDADLGDYPFQVAALRRSYAAVTQRIGVSEVTPSTMAAPVRHVLERSSRQRPQHGFMLAAAENAVLSEAMADRQACTRCGLCLYGCGRKSIYASSFELPALLRHPGFSYAPGHLVRAILPEAGGHGLEVEAGGARRPLSAPTLVLAAGTIASSGLALRRLGVTDRSIRLLSNPAAVVAFLVPRFFGQDLPDLGFGLGQLVYQVALPEGGPAFGVLYGGDTLPVDLVANRLPLARPVALRMSRALAPALLLATCYLPGDYSRNSLTARTGGAGGTLMIESEHSAAADATLREAVKRLRGNLRPLGAHLLPGSLKVVEAGADAHYAGTLPMGASSPVATTEFGELVDCPGVFVADGACLPSLPAKHPTLTIMANADRIGRELARRIVSQSRNIESGPRGGVAAAQLPLRRPSTAGLRAAG